MFSCNIFAVCYCAMECFFKTLNGIMIFRGQWSVVKSKFCSDFFKASGEAIQPPIDFTLEDVVAVGEFYPLTLILTPSLEIFGLLVTDHSDVGIVTLSIGLEPLGNEGLVKETDTLINIQNESVPVARYMVVVESPHGLEESLAHRPIILRLCLLLLQYFYEPIIILFL